MPNPTDFDVATRLPAIPGSLWSMLAKLSWSNPDLVRAHSIPATVLVQGVANADGVATETEPARVAGKKYFLVRQITGFVDWDPATAVEAHSANYISFQVEDQERQFPVFREAMRMGSIAGIGENPRPTPLDFEDSPLVFLPAAQIVVTFTPLQAFPVGVHSLMNGATTRRVGIELHGFLVAEPIVERLLEMNDEVLRSTGLLGAKSQK